MIFDPGVKRIFLLLSVVIIAAVLSSAVNGQCGVYLRRSSTQQIPYSKVYLDKVADMNNDGKMDLLASQDVSGNDSTRERILIVPGNGNGTFGTAITIDAPTNFDDNYAVGKINNDVLNDIVAFTDYSTDPTSMLIYINNGNGTFTPKPAVSATGMGRPIDFTDLNGDGKTDYIGSMWNGGQIRYSLGNGDGTFAPAVAINNNGTGSAGDFNGDGKRDYATYNTILINNGDLTFASIDYSWMLTFNEYIGGVNDFNGDGKSDLLIASLSATPRFAIFTSTGTGFTRTDYTITTEGNSEGFSIAGNFSGNSAPDIVYTYRYKNKKVVYTNDGAGNFTREDLDQRLFLYNFLRSAQADFDGDGTRDTAVLVAVPTGGGRVQYIAVCLERKAQLQLHLIREPYCGDGIRVARKGQTVYNYQTGKNVTYRTNGVHAYCFEKAGGTYLYKNGRFELVVDSD